MACGNQVMAYYKNETVKSTRLAPPTAARYLLSY